MNTTLPYTSFPDQHLWWYVLLKQQLAIYHFVQ